MEHAKFMALLRGFAGLCLLTACAPSDEGEGRARLRVSPAAAVIVNGEPISLGEVELEAVSQGIIEPGTLFDVTHDQFEFVLDQLIDQRLLAQEALRQNLDHPPSAQHRLSVARERVLGNLLVENLVATHVDEAAIAQMYADQVGLQQLDDEVQISHILFETKADAERVRAEAVEGGDFAALAFEHSRDTGSRINGGSLGYVAPNALAEPFSAIIGDTKVGDVSKPFESERGWHILKVEDRRQRAPQTLEEMRPEIVRFLTLSEISDVLRALRASATISGPGTPIPQPLPDAAGDELAE